jgi:hypothetical protein
MTPTLLSNWTGGRIAMIVAGSLVALNAVAVIVGGAYGLCCTRLSARTAM